MSKIGIWSLAGGAAWLVVTVSGCAAMPEETEGGGMRQTSAITADVLQQGPPGAPVCGAESVDPATGALVTLERAHSLHIPPNQSWAGTTRVRISELAADYVGVRVQPSGQQFNPTATLTISFDHCPADVLGPFKIYRRQGSGWTRLDDSKASHHPRAVQVERASASDYALGAN